MTRAARAAAARRRPDPDRQSGAWLHKLIDEVGGEAEAIAWPDQEQGHQGQSADHAPATRDGAATGFFNIGRWVGGEARAALGLPSEGPVALDGLVSLWQVGS